MLEEVESTELIDTRRGSIWGGGRSRRDSSGEEATTSSVSSRCSRSALSLLALEWDMIILTGFFLFFCSFVILLLKKVLKGYERREICPKLDTKKYKGGENER